MRRRLEHLAKLETVAQLTGGVAHDFNNLLTVAMGCLDMIRRDETNAHTARLAETALRSIDRGAQLTQQLLSFARRQTLRPVAANLNNLLRDIEVLIRRAMGERISVVIDAANVPACAVDPAQFESAIMNLVINARDAMPRGGRLVLATRWLEAAHLPADVELPAGDYVALVVADTGDGMTPEVAARALEPFYTTKEIGKGSGLGLSMVYGFARQSGGDLYIETVPGEGTNVTLYFPAVRSATNSVAPLPPEEEQLGFGTILLVEDDDAVREISLEIIQDLGYEALVARNGEEALEVLHSDRLIDLLFTDIVMPGDLTGAMLAREARKLRPGLPVLLVTGYAGAENPADDEFPVITKPFPHSRTNPRHRAPDRRSPWRDESSMIVRRVGCRLTREAVGIIQKPNPKQATRRSPAAF